MWQAGTNGAPAAQSKAADSAAIRAAIGGGHKAATSEVNKISSGKANGKLSVVWCKLPWIVIEQGSSARAPRCDGNGHEGRLEGNAG